MASEGLSHLKGSDTADAMMRVVYSVLSRHSLFHSFPFMNLNERGKRLIRWCRIKDEKEASLLARYEYRLLGSRCSLRMLKLLPTLFGEVIKCELTEVHPRDVQPNQPLTWNCEPFEAISWVWSRDERNRTICIGDGTQWFSLQIPPALASCLAALRLDDKPRHIWIDFLCSDRSNPQELSDQPFIFHSIFAAAEGVCAWLGNGNDNSDLAINFIKTTSSTHDSWQRSRNEETKETFVQGVALVEIFLSQPWFSRRWIIQEVAWAQRCMLYCGQNSLSWEELSEWAEAFGMFLTKSLPCGAMTAPNDLNNGFRMIDVINKAFRCGSSNGSRSYMLDLEYLVTSLAPFEVSIPHDQVYALLSLASRQPPGRPKTKFPSGAYGEPLVVLDKRNMNMVGYHVDYNQPYDEFCKEFVQFSVMMSSSIDIICRPWAANLDLSRIKLPSQGIQLPSWIATINRANLTHQPVNGDILVKLQGPSQTRYMSSGGKQVDFTSLRFKKYCSGWSLFVRGFVLDEVKQKSVASQEGNIPYEWSKFAKWEDFDNDPPDGYWRTLVADQGTSTTTAAPSFYRRAVKDLYSGAAKKGFDILAQQTIQSDVGRVVRNVMEKIQSIICNRSLARIGHSGALGLVPRDTQIGDLICVLYGCSVPVVLRRFPKTEEEIWEQRAENIREEQAAVVIQRAYRSRLCLIYKPKSLSAVAGPFKDRPTQHCTMAEIQLRRLNRQLGPDQPQPQDRKAESATSMRKSITREGKWSSRIRCSAIILVFMCTTRVWPMDSSLGPPLGLLAFVVIAFMEVSRANEHQIAQKEEVVPEESTLKTPTKPRLLPLSLSKRPDYYYYKVIGESYVHGMMYGEAIRLQEKERIPEQVFELR